MRLICPVCGAGASIEAWENDPIIRQFEAKFMSLPAVIQPRVRAYLALFRKEGVGLPWKQALKHITDLADLVAAGRVSWKHSELRPAPPELWAEALDAVLAAAPRGLSNQNYLKHTAFDMAAGLAAKVERQAEADKAHREYTGPVLRGDESISEEERAEVAKALKAFTQKFGG